MLAKSILNRFETLISQALIDLEIRNEEFKTILNEKDKYEKMKENIRKMKGDYEKDNLRESSKIISKNSGNV